MFVVNAHPYTDSGPAYQLIVDNSSASDWMTYYQHHTFKKQGQQQKASYTPPLPHALDSDKVKDDWLAGKRLT